MANVLVVARREDEAENLRSLLVEGGHTVTVAVGGFFALTLLERNRPEIVFAWANTGDMPGEEFCSIVRGDPAMDAVQLLLLGRGLNATAPPGVLLAPGFSTPSEIVDLIHGALGLPPRLPGPEPEKPPDEKPQDELQGRLDIVRLFGPPPAPRARAPLGLPPLRLPDRRGAHLLFGRAARRRQVRRGLRGPRVRGDRPGGRRGPDRDLPFRQERPEGDARFPGDDLLAARAATRECIRPARTPPRTVGLRVTGSPRLRRDEIAGRAASPGEQE